MRQFHWCHVLLSNGNTAPISYMLAIKPYLSTRSLTRSLPCSIHTHHVHSKQRMSKRDTRRNNKALSLMCMSAPARTRASTQAKCEWYTAVCSAVLPNCHTHVSDFFHNLVREGWETMKVRSDHRCIGYVQLRVAMDQEVHQLETNLQVGRRQGWRSDGIVCFCVPRSTATLP